MENVQVRHTRSDCLTNLVDVLHCMEPQNSTELSAVSAVVGVSLHVKLKQIQCHGAKQRYLVRLSMSD